jgi:hypothetical protein
VQQDVFPHPGGERVIDHPDDGDAFRQRRIGQNLFEARTDGQNRAQGGIGAEETAARLPHHGIANLIRLRWFRVVNDGVVRQERREAFSPRGGT